MILIKGIRIILAWLFFFLVTETLTQPEVFIPEGAAPRDIDESTINWETLDRVYTQKLTILPDTVGSRNSDYVFSFYIERNLVNDSYFFSVNFTEYLLAEQLAF